MSKSKPYRLTEADYERIAVAMHEAGHACAAILFGAKVRRAVLGDNPRTEFHDLPGRYQAEITYAGPWCEARFRAGRRGRFDINRAMPIGSSDYTALVAAGGPDAGLGVVPVLHRSWSAVVTVTKKLFFDGHAGHRDVCAALGLSDEGGPGSFELANIRAGLRSLS